MSVRMMLASIGFLGVTLFSQADDAPNRNNKKNQPHVPNDGMHKSVNDFIDRVKKNLETQERIKRLKRDGVLDNFDPDNYYLEPIRDFENKFIKQA